MPAEMMAGTPAAFARSPYVALALRGGVTTSKHVDVYTDQSKGKQKEKMIMNVGGNLCPWI